MSHPDDNVSDQLQRWLDGDRPKTLGSLIDVFQHPARASANDAACPTIWKPALRSTAAAIPL